MNKIFGNMKCVLWQMKRKKEINCKKLVTTSQVHVIANVVIVWKL